MATGEGLLAGYDPKSDAGLGTTYDVWLRNALGGSPLAYQYGQQMAPWTQLSYLTDPVRRVPTDTGGVTYNPANLYAGVAYPFNQWLGSGAGTGRTAPLSSDEWMRRAMDVSRSLDPSILMSGGGWSDTIREQMVERFGAENEAAEARQRALAFAPILAGTSRALRGEIGNILNRQYDDWLVNKAQPDESFLSYAMGGTGGEGGLWERYLGRGRPTAQGGSTGTD